MFYLKKTLLFLFLTSVGFILFIGTYLLSAYCLSRICVNCNNQSNQEVPIYILSNGVHTDLVFPIKSSTIDWSKTIKFANTVSKDSAMNYIGIGWGDKGFYLDTPTWADLTFATGFRAAFWLSTSAVHATFHKQIKMDTNCRQILISKDQYKILIEYIDASLLKDQNGEIINIITNANYGKNDAFYEGVGSYSLFKTCNTWTNRGLKKAGLKACFWTPFDTGIFYHYK